jgi:hypothetical protein
MMPIVQELFGVTLDRSFVVDVADVLDGSEVLCSLIF